MASSVEKRIALILPVFILERLTLAIPTRSDNSFSVIFRSAITRSSRKIIVNATSQRLVGLNLQMCTVLEHVCQQQYRKADEDGREID